MATITTQHISEILSWACKNGHLDLVNECLDVRKIHREEFLSCFQNACHGGYVAIVQRLLRTGFSANFQEIKALVSLHTLLCEGHMDMVKFLHSLYPKGYFNCVENHSLLACANNGHLNLVLYFTENVKIPLHHLDDLIFKKCAQVQENYIAACTLLERVREK